MPPDVRAEAGYNFGALYAGQGNNTRAREIFWLVASRFLLDDNAATALQAKGRYWVARALLDLGQLEANRSAAEAVKVYALVEQYRLPGTRLARQRMEQLQGPNNASVNRQ